MAPIDPEHIHMSNVYCGHCNKEFNCPNRDINRAKKRGGLNYCSRDCFNASRCKSILINCQECHIQISRKPSEFSGKNFCSHSCSITYHNRFRLGDKHPNWKPIANISNYRIRAIENFGSECQKCHYNQYEAMLDVHHKDGNRKNNNMDNLEVLCLWCHGLLTRNIPEHYHVFGPSPEN